MAVPPKVRSTTSTFPPLWSDSAKASRASNASESPYRITRRFVPAVTDTTTTDASKTVTATSATTGRPPFRASIALRLSPKAEIGTAPRLVHFDGGLSRLRGDDAD